MKMETVTSNSGYLGLIIIPDEHTTRKSMELSQTHAPGWEFQNDSNSIFAVVYLKSPPKQ